MVDIDIKGEKNIGIANIDRSSQVFTVKKGNPLKFYTCLRLKTLKTIPCSAAHTRIGQIRECHPPPPPFRPLVLLSRQGRKWVWVFTKKRDTILTLVLTLYEIKGYMIYENSCKNRRRLPGRGMCRPTGSWFWSSRFRTGYPFQRRFLERGMKNCGSRLYLLLKIVVDYEEAFIWCISRTNKEIFNLQTF